MWLLAAKRIMSSLDSTGLGRGWLKTTTSNFRHVFMKITNVWNGDVL